MTPDQLAALHAKVSEQPWSAQSFAAQIEQSGAVLVHNKHAFALGRIVLDEAELLQIATHPAHQRQGHAQSMLASFEQEIAQRGCMRAYLEVATDNAPAIALYTTTGWTSGTLRKAYYRLANGTRMDALMMSKNL